MFVCMLEITSFKIQLGCLGTSLFLSVLGKRRSPTYIYFLMYAEFDPQHGEGCRGWDAARHAAPFTHVIGDVAQVTRGTTRSTDTWRQSGGGG